MLGYIRRCQPRTSQTCSSSPWPLAADATASVASSSLSLGGAGSFSWNRCPTGQTCVNGVCKICPMLMCMTIYCPLEQQQMQYNDGCRTCPICPGGGSGSCTSDSDCGAGQACVSMGLYRRCQPRVTGQNCFAWPSLATDFSASSVALGTSASLYGSRCPSGQVCINGACQPCPMPPCAQPLCLGGNLIPTTMANGCPGCPRCSGGGGSCTGIYCSFLPCCPPVATYGQAQCRDCGLRG